MDARMSWLWRWLYPKIVYQPKMVNYLRNNRAISCPLVKATPQVANLACQQLDHPGFKVKLCFLLAISETLTGLEYSAPVMIWFVTTPNKLSDNHSCYCHNSSNETEKCSPSQLRCLILSLCLFSSAVCRRNQSCWLRCPIWTLCSCSQHRNQLLSRLWASLSSLMVNYQQKTK